MSFAEPSRSGSITIGTTNSIQGVIYEMADDKSMGQTYYDEVEALKNQGVSNAEAIRQVAAKFDKNENAVRGGIHQYRSRHVSGNGSSAPSGRPRRRAASLSVEDYMASARQALEAARDLVDREVTEAKSALDAARTRYDEVSASVKDRKVDIEKKLKALA